MDVWVKSSKRSKAFKVRLTSNADMDDLAKAIVMEERLACPASVVEVTMFDNSKLRASDAVVKAYDDKEIANSEVHPFIYSTTECAGGALVVPMEIVSCAQEKLLGLMSMYQSALRTDPLKTKAITSCIVSLFGEVICTYLNATKDKRLGNRYGGFNQTANPIVTVFGHIQLVLQNLNWKRLVTFGSLGGLLVGPVFHYWYAYLDQLSLKVTDMLFKYLNQQRITEPRDINQVRASVLKLLVKLGINQIMFTPPFVLCQLLFVQVFLATFNQSSYAAAVRNVKGIYAVTLLSNLKLWTPCQLFNFTYVPLEYSVLFGNFVAVWWNIYLSSRM